MIFTGRWDCVSLFAFCLFGFYLGFKVKLPQFFVIYQIFLIIHTTVLIAYDKHEFKSHDTVGFRPLTKQPPSRAIRLNLQPAPKSTALQSIGKLPETGSPDLVGWNPEDIRNFYPRIFSQLPDRFDNQYKNPCWSSKEAVVPRGGSITTRTKSQESSGLMCLPYVYLLGQPKCGTSDLFERLIHHPSIHGGDRKEIRWFTRGEFSTTKLSSSSRLGKETDLHSFTTRFQEASDLIKNNNKDIILDGGPHTLWWSTQEADGTTSNDVPIPQLLKQMQPDAKFIIILQDPVDRAYSDYNFIGDDMKPVSKGSYQSKSPQEFHDRVSEEMEEFNMCVRSEAGAYSVGQFSEYGIWFRAAQICAQDRHSFAKSGWGRISIGMYAVFIEKWLDYFSPEQFLVLNLEDMKNGLSVSLRSVLKFLDVGEIDESSPYWETMLSEKVANVHRFDREDMHAETRGLLNDFYRPFNEGLVEMLKDSKFMWGAGSGSNARPKQPEMEKVEESREVRQQGDLASPEFVEKLVRQASMNIRNTGLSAEALCTAAMALDAFSVETLVQKYNINADIRNHMDINRNAIHCLTLIWALADATAKSHVYSRLKGVDDWLTPYLYPPEDEPDGNAVTRDIIWRMKDRVLDVADILYDAGAEVDDPDGLHMTPLQYAAHGGIDYMVDWLLGKEDVDIHQIGWHGQTALHQAGLHGHAEIAAMLIKAGADVNEQDQYGTSFMDLANEPGPLVPWDTKYFLNIDQRGPRLVKLDPFIKEHFGNGGWDEEMTFHLPALERLSECDVDQYYASEITAADLYKKYIARNRPVLLRGLLYESKGWEAYKKQNLIDNFGKMNVHVSDIPYNTKFGSKQGEESTLAEYISTMDEAYQPGGEYPWYVFKGNPVPQESEKIGSIVHPSIIQHPQIILEAESNIAQTKGDQTFVNMQWAIGSSGTGAPLHFHNSAWNMLFYGKKKWVMFPPDTMLMSNIQIKLWIEKHLNPDAEGGYKPLTCTQHSGDVVLIPESWAHGVINFQDSVAVASEVRGSMYRIHPLPKAINNMPDQHDTRHHS